MAVGDSALIGGDSYLAIGRETTFGTGVTATAALDFATAALKFVKEYKVVEQIERSRVNSKRIPMSAVTEGEIEFYFAPRVNACNWILQNAMGGTVTSATATGETAGGGAFTHTFEIGSQDQTYKSLTINMRKGNASAGKVFEYVGCKVNELSFSAEIDEGLIATAGIVAKDATAGASSVASFITVTAAPLLSFVDGRVSVETNFNSLTSSSFWHVQAVEFGINNQINSDSEARRIGSDTPAVLPPGMADLSLKATIRFDTLTAFNAMKNATQLSVQLEFLGPTMSGSAIRQGIKFNYPRVFIDDAGDPEVADASGILQSEVTFRVLRDDTTSTGYGLQVQVTNDTSSYA